VRAFNESPKQRYLNSEGENRPLKSPIPVATLEAARAYRLGRLRRQLVNHDCAAALLYDLSLPFIRSARCWG
jgi:hypothetical protein